MLAKSTANESDLRTVAMMEANTVEKLETKLVLVMVDVRVGMQDEKMVEQMVANGAAKMAFEMADLMVGSMVA